MRYFFMGIAIAAFAVAASPAHAQLDQTWVASNGNNGANCSRATPCADFGTAISKTNAGGQINCVDSGQYSNTTISKAITIDCTGVLATVTGGSMVIAVPGGTKVSLRGLNIRGAASGPGIFVNVGGDVDVENCVIEGNGGPGLSIAPTNATQVRVINTSITKNNAAGIQIQPSGGPVVTLAVTRSNVSGNGLGIRVIGSSGATTRAQITDSTISNNNAGEGIGAFTGAQPTTVMVANSLISSNGANGVRSDGAGAVVLLNGNSITNNATALVSTNGGALFSYGNNAVNDNGSVGAAPTVVALR